MCVCFLLSLFMCTAALDVPCCVCVQVWMGDMNYHCAGVTATEALGFIRQGRSRQLLVDHDELLQERAGNHVRDRTLLLAFNLLILLRYHSRSCRSTSVASVQG